MRLRFKLYVFALCNSVSSVVWFCSYNAEIRQASLPPQLAPSRPDANAIAPALAEQYPPTAKRTPGKTRQLSRWPQCPLFPSSHALHYAHFNKHQRDRKAASHPLTMLLNSSVENEPKSDSGSRH